MFDSIFKIIMFLGSICLAYLLGKKNTYDKGYNNGFDSGYESGYEEGQTDTLKQIHGIKKKEY